MKKHITVLTTEAVSALQLQPQSVVVDATYGAGGHAKEICKILRSKGTFIGIDADPDALTDSDLHKLKSGPTIHLINDNFVNLDKILESLEINEADAILADLGWRTDQFEDGGKGFSFTSDEPLLMTYGDPETYLFTAHDIVNGWKEEDIANVLYGYGDERFSRRIAKAIVASRAVSEINTALRLSMIIESAVPHFYRKGKTHPATKSFQAIRIAVNDELSYLETFIDKAASFVAVDGIIAIISFHSTEDRIVKLKFKELASSGEFQIITKKPITASVEELSNNPRARSAKLRVIKKVE
jgi:16S rRNA (cytosine1402-N4)-methyltransferase